MLFRSEISQNLKKKTKTNEEKYRNYSSENYNKTLCGTVPQGNTNPLISSYDDEQDDISKPPKESLSSAKITTKKTERNVSCQNVHIIDGANRKQLRQNISNATELSLINNPKKFQKSNEKSIAPKVLFCNPRAIAIVRPGKTSNPQKVILNIDMLKTPKRPVSSHIKHHNGTKLPLSSANENVCCKAHNVSYIEGHKPRIFA